VEIITPSTAAEEIPLPPGQPEDSFSEPQEKEEDLSGTERGNMIHQLLQVAADLGSLPPGGGDLYAEAEAVFEDPELAWIFKPENGRGLSEVPVTHRRKKVTAGSVEERITGSIDRLVLRPGRADIIDFKTNRNSGNPDYRQALVEHYRPQLAAYREVIEALFPDREVRTWLLFTDPQARESESSPLVEVR
jgi:ATP-dependent helicase/nuclease subunit A